MRIWSIHPKYLDAKGLVALWRETLLAKNVLAGNTKGYRNHPQLTRFKETTDPLSCINQYLADVYTEAEARNYHFSRDKIDWNFQKNTLNLTTGQLRYETDHLLQKLKLRDEERYWKLKDIDLLECHSIFRIVEGDVETWEVLQKG